MIQQLILLGLVTVAAAQIDVVVYDATSGGVMAAVAAARHGAKVVLVCASWPACFEEGGKRVGGMSSGGLGQVTYMPFVAVCSGPRYRQGQGQECSDFAMLLTILTNMAMFFSLYSQYLLALTNRHRQTLADTSRSLEV